VGRAELLRDVIRRRRKSTMPCWNCSITGNICLVGGVGTCVLLALTKRRYVMGVLFEAGLVSRWASTTIDGSLNG
jgi:hypothetical protein